MAKIKRKRYISHYKVFGEIGKINDLVIDIEGTVSPSNGFSSKRMENVMSALRRYLKEDVNITGDSGVDWFLEKRRLELSRLYGHPVSIIHIALSCGMTPERIRRIAIDSAPGHPRSFFRPNYPLREAVLRILTETDIKLVFGTNVPPEMGTQILETVLGAGAYKVSGLNGGTAKPEPLFFKRIIRRWALDAPRAVSVGDRLGFDCWPAMIAGIPCAVRVESPDGLRQFLEDILENKWHK